MLLALEVWPLRGAPFLPPLIPRLSPPCLPPGAGASKDPWTDKQACKAWLPWGDCRKVKKSYRPACCDNKPWDAPGCYTPPRPGASCASRPPKDQDKCCATLWNVRTDPQGCPAWQPRNGGCESVSWRYRDQCWCAGAGRGRGGD